MIDSIANAIYNADVVIACITKEYEGSLYCKSGVFLHGLLNCSKFPIQFYE